MKIENVYIYCKAVGSSSSVHMQIKETYQTNLHVFFSAQKSILCDAFSPLIENAVGRTLFQEGFNCNIFKTLHFKCSWVKTSLLKELKRPFSIA